MQMLSCSLILHVIYLAAHSEQPPTGFKKMGHTKAGGVRTLRGDVRGQWTPRTSRSLTLYAWSSSC